MTNLFRHNPFMLLHEKDGGGENPPNPPDDKGEPENVDELKNSLHATRRREKEMSEKYSSLENQFSELKSNYEELNNKHKELTQKELSDLDKTKTELDETQKKLEQMQTEYEDLKAFKQDRDEREQVKVEKAMESFDDETKELINNLPLYSRLTYIEKLQTKGIDPPDAHGKPQNNKDDDWKEKYRNMTPTQRDAYAKEHVGAK